TRRSPLEDVRHLREVVGVMANGRWIDDTERRRLLGAIPHSYQAMVARLVRQADTDLAAVDAELAANDPLGAVSSAVLTGLSEKSDSRTLSQALRRLHRSSPQSPLTTEETLNQLGYGL